MKKKLWKLLKPAAHRGLCLFFDRKYLTGRWFESTNLGYVWAIKSIFQKNILRLGKPLPWPSSLTCNVSRAERIFFHPDDLNNFQSGGTYFQCYSANIEIGRGTYVAPNVGIITANHDVNDLDKVAQARDVVISDKCWIGMNAVILPGVFLGPGTIVAAGAVVTKSFREGGIIIGGVPAKILRSLK